MTVPRRFQQPWTVVEDSNDACFIARDHNGADALACVYLGETQIRGRRPSTLEPGCRS